MPLQDSWDSGRRGDGLGWEALSSLLFLSCSIVWGPCLCACLGEEVMTLPLPTTCLWVLCLLPFPFDSSVLMPATLPLLPVPYLCLLYLYTGEEEFSSPRDEWGGVFPDIPPSSYYPYLPTHLLGERFYICLLRQFCFCCCCVLCYTRACTHTFGVCAAARYTHAAGYSLPTCSQVSVGRLWRGNACPMHLPCLPVCRWMVVEPLPTLPLPSMPMCLPL